MGKKNFKKDELVLLGTLYAIQSKSGQEDNIRKFLIQEISSIPNIEKIETDKVGNLLVTKGIPKEGEYYPCIVAHMDTVHDYKYFDVKVVKIEFSDGKEIIRCKKLTSPTDKEEKWVNCGGSGDDKNGVYIALDMLKKKKVLKSVFFVSEESGMIGSRNVDLSFFDDCAYVIQSDRRNAGDLITKYHQNTKLCSEEFLNSFKSVIEKYSFKEESGLPTDVITMKDKGLNISVINFSSGYYNPHTDNEYTIISELYNSNCFASELIDIVPLNEKYIHKVEEKSYKTTTYYGGASHNTKWAKDYEYDDYYSENGEWKDWVKKNLDDKESGEKLKDCICTEQDIFLKTVNLNCKIHNPIIKEKMEFICEDCLTELTERELTIYCETCDTHKLKVK
jgi:tripeptide aminopeptidase